MCLGLATAAPADWKDLLDALTGGADSGPQEISNQEILAGLKQALEQGARQAVDTLGRTDGFLADARVRIPMPPELEQVESALRTFGQERYADEFVVTMNRAAEAAVPEASAILRDAIAQMTVNDARQILEGPDDAATRYFRRTGEERLAARMRPIVSEATSKAGVTSAYKSLMDKAGFAARLAGAKTAEIDGYVTTQA